MNVIKVFYYFLGPVVITIIGTGIYFTTRGILESNKVLEYGTSKCATILAKRKNSVNTYIDIKYYHDGQLFKKTLSVSMDEYDSIYINREIKIIFYYKYPNHPLLYNGKPNYCKSIFNEKTWLKSQ